MRCVSPCALVLILLAGISVVEAATVKVRLREGASRGFLVVRNGDGQDIGYGELIQRPSGRLVDNRLTLSFIDGSLWDEHVTFSQDKIFRLESYRLTQRGPSYPTSEVSFDRRSGRFKARTQQTKGDDVRAAEGPLEMPADLYNGMALVLLKNLGSGANTSVQTVVFTPKPRIIRMDLVSTGDQSVQLGPAAKRVTQFLAKLEVTGLAGVVAGLMGKDPPDVRYWLVAGDVPAFVRFEGAMYLNGPVWRIEQTAVTWPR